MLLTVSKAQVSKAHVKVPLKHYMYFIGCSLVPGFFLFFFLKYVSFIGIIRVQKGTPEISLLELSLSA